MDIKIIDLIEKEVKYTVKNGIRFTVTKMPLPIYDLSLSSTQIYSSKLSFNFHQSYSKINDLNLISTDSLKLYTSDYIKAETDIDKIIKEYKIANSKITIADFSYNGRFYREESKRKSGNEVKSNNIFSNCGDLIKFITLKPLFNLNTEWLLIKFPTTTGNTIFDIIRTCSYIFDTLEIIKHADDSWLKDSFILLCKGPNSLRLDEFKDKMRRVLKDNKWHNTYEKSFINLLDFNTYTNENEYIITVNNFLGKVSKTIYAIHSLLYLSLTSKDKTKNNVYQKYLNDILL